MLKNSIENNFIDVDEKFSYILPVVNKICKLAGLEVVEFDNLKFKANNAFIGTSDVKKLKAIATAALSEGVANTIVVSGKNLPFLAPFGNCSVAEAWKNKIFTYTINHKDLEIKKADIDKISVENIQEAKFVADEILSGKLRDSKYDTVVFNAAFPLYISKKTQSIFDGMELAKK